MNEEEKELLKYIAARQNPDVTVRDKFEELKPTVPRFVADWYEENKDDFEYNLYQFCIDYYNDDLDMKMMSWFHDEHNKQIQTLVNMHQFGYRVNKENLYTAKLKLTNEYLVYESQFDDLLHYKVPDSSSKEVKAYHFTEDDLVKYGIWGNNYYEVEEVK